MMAAFLTGIGWVTGAGFGTGRQGGDCSFPELPLPSLTRKDVFPEPNQRFGRMSDYAKLGLAATAFALRDAGLEAWSEKRPIGVVASTRFGCLATDLDYHGTVQLQGGGLASPNLFAYTLANCFLGDAAIQFGLTGSSVAINESGEDRLGALRLALEALLMGEADTMLAGVCDLPAPRRYAGETGQAPGAAFLVLTLAAPAAPAPYGSVALAGGDGGVLFNGSPQVGLQQLIDSALAGRTAR
ncbi:MAG TPA: beta-ketoacyl synthase [Geobacter sp.]|nr:beta-ketoacyl synthase [Geobacter sp.]